MTWAPDYLAAIDKRITLLNNAKGNLEAQSVLRDIYAADCVHWIEDWCITYDPRVSDVMFKTMPFILFDKQKEFVQFIMELLRDQECGLVEKARDMGATWLCCAISVWLWLFMPGAAVGWGSRKSELVDKLGDPDSIFEKMRMILRNLPSWQLPADFEIETHATHMKIINPVNASSITGEIGDQIGRGGRKLIYFKDESAHYERPEKIEAALGDNTNVQIDISSVKGTGNVFYRRRNAGIVYQPGTDIEKGKTRVFIFDWRDNPLKTLEWYERRRRKAEEEGLSHIFAQEVDRDYTASLEGIIIPNKHVVAAIDAHIKLGITDDGEITSGLDVADEGGDKNAQAIKKGVILKFLDQWAMGDTGKTARRALGNCKLMAAQYLYYDSIGVGAGVKAETNRLEEEGELPEGLFVLPWNAASKPLYPTRRILLDDANSPKNEDYFGNFKAQSWWSLAQRFYKTYMAVTEGIIYPHEELISLPSDLPYLHELVNELSQATQGFNGKGKMIVDKKPDGAKSPNLAECVIIAYNPTRKLSILDVL